MTPISLETAALITGRSKRTWQRRIADGLAEKLESDPLGRTMIPLRDIAPSIPFRMSTEDLEQLALADAGAPEAQDDMGQLFLAAGHLDVAIYWLEQAAQQNYPNAMQCLGRCYLAGEGVPKDENLAVMWIAKAAAHGHVIAQGQMQTLRGVAP